MFSRTSLHSAPPGTARRPHFRFSWWLATAHSEYLHPTYCRGKRSRRLRAAQSRKLAGAEADVLQPDQGQGLNPLLPRPSQRVRLDTEGGLPPAQATLPLEAMPQKPSNKFLFLLKPAPESSALGHQACHQPEDLLATLLELSTEVSTDWL